MIISIFNFTFSITKSVVVGKSNIKAAGLLDFDHTQIRFLQIKKPSVKTTKIYQNEIRGEFRNTTKPSRNF